MTPVIREVMAKIMGKADDAGEMKSSPAWPQGTRDHRKSVSRESPSASASRKHVSNLPPQVAILSLRKRVMGNLKNPKE